MPTRARERSSVTTILARGHETPDPADLAAVEADVARPGRELRDSVAGALTAGSDVVVVPMTWGRDPAMVADTARTLRWLAAGAGAGRVAQAATFGTPDHLVAWLRHAAGQVQARQAEAAVLVTAPAADPFDDAELHRLAHLVRCHGATAVEVATMATPGDLAGAVRRAQLLGSAEVVVVPAGFARTAPPALPTGATFHGPLLAPSVLGAVVAQRVESALHALDHGDDGIAGALLADHDHGYAHSHAGDAGHEHHPRHEHEHEHHPGRPAAHARDRPHPHGGPVPLP